jgi:hypothetical protein
MTFPPGHYISKASIPANMLNATQYELRFFAGIHNKRRCFPDYISFLLNVLANNIVNSSYPDYKSPGKLLPKIHWSTISLAENSKTPS